MIRALVVDDHAVVRQGLIQILSDHDDFAVPGEATSATEAIRMGKEQDWDLVILDLTMPGGGGLEAMRELKHAKPKMPILVLSVHAGEQYAIRTLRAGASGYLTKECAPEELIQAARRVVAGGKYISTDVAEVLADNVSQETDQPRHEALSDREFQTLRLLAQGQTTSEIAEQLSLSPKTVSTYRRRILDKLKLESTADIIRYALDNDLSE